jgi:hypothetical protein
MLPRVLPAAKADLWSGFAAKASLIWCRKSGLEPLTRRLEQRKFFENAFFPIFGPFLAPVLFPEGPWYGVQLCQFPQILTKKCPTPFHLCIYSLIRSKKLVRELLGTYFFFIQNGGPQTPINPPWAGLASLRCHRKAQEGGWRGWGGRKQRKNEGNVI